MLKGAWVHATIERNTKRVICFDFLKIMKGFYRGGLEALS